MVEHIPALQRPFEEPAGQMNKDGAQWVDSMALVISQF
jgi:hypothetical protein